jgi:synaptosomal-associated protein 25
MSGTQVPKLQKWTDIKDYLIFQVSSMIGNLRNMASDMSGELENQNAQLDRINVKAASDITRVKMANDKAAALMK